MTDVVYRVELSAGATKWLHKHRGTTELAKVKAHLQRMMTGNLGTTRQIEGNLYEKKINTAGGIRIYYFIKLQNVIKVLGIGNKSTQSRDIIKVKKLWQKEIKK